MELAGHGVALSIAGNTVKCSGASCSCIVRNGVASIDRCRLATAGRAPAHMHQLQSVQAATGIKGQLADNLLLLQLGGRQ